MRAVDRVAVYQVKGWDPLVLGGSVAALAAVCVDREHRSRAPRGGREPGDGAAGRVNRVADSSSVKRILKPRGLSAHPKATSEDWENTDGPTLCGTCIYSARKRAAELKHGSRHLYERVEKSAVLGDTLGPAEQAFIRERDGFYMASVSETRMAVHTVSRWAEGLSAGAR